MSADNESPATPILPKVRDEVLALLAALLDPEGCRSGNSRDAFFRAHAHLLAAKQFGEEIGSATSMAQLMQMAERTDLAPGTGALVF